jgi:nitrogenase subunit NifH
VVKECGGQAKTVFTLAPDSEEAGIYTGIGDAVLANKDLVIPNTIEFEDLYDWWLQYFE